MNRRASCTLTISASDCHQRTNLYGSRPLCSSIRQHGITELNSPVIGWLGLLPVSEVQWAQTLSCGVVLMAESDRETVLGCHHFSLMPPPLLALASPGWSPGCESLDEPLAPHLVGKIHQHFNKHSSLISI